MSRDVSLEFCEDLELMNLDIRHMMQWLKWYLHFFHTYWFSLQSQVCYCRSRIRKRKWTIMIMDNPEMDW